ncbi:heme-binding protein [Mycolicibacterium thermoresistibile]
MSSPRSARRGLTAATFIGTVSITLLLTNAPGATAQPAPPPQPNCTSADLANVMAGVSSATANYLFTHPEVNDFFTGLKGLPHDQMRAEVAEYGDRNPQVRAELQALRQPAVDFRARCG